MWKDRRICYQIPFERKIVIFQDGMKTRLRGSWLPMSRPRRSVGRFLSSSLHLLPGVFHSALSLLREVFVCLSSRFDSLSRRRFLSLRRFFMPIVLLVLVAFTLNVPGKGGKERMMRAKILKTAYISCLDLVCFPVTCLSTNICSSIPSSTFQLHLCDFFREKK